MRSAVFACLALLVCVSALAIEKSAHKAHSHVHQKAVNHKAKAAMHTISSARIGEVRHAVSDLKQRLRAAKHNMHPAAYKRYSVDLEKISSDVNKLENPHTKQEEASLTKEINSRMDNVRRMASEVEKTQSNKAQTTSAETKTPSSTTATTTTPSTPSIAHKSIEEIVSQSQHMLEVAKRAVKAAHLEGKAQADMEANLNHMKTDVDMMKTTNNREAISDLYQALQLRNSKVAKLGPLPELEEEDEDALTINSVKSLLNDLEKTELAKTSKGQSDIKSLKKTLGEFEQSKSSTERETLAQKMQSIISSLEATNQSLEENESNTAEPNNKPETNASKEVADEKVEEQSEGAEDNKAQQKVDDEMEAKNDRSPSPSEEAQKELTEVKQDQEEELCPCKDSASDDDVTSECPCKKEAKEIPELEESKADVKSSACPCKDTASSSDETAECPCKNEVEKGEKHLEENDEDAEDHTDGEQAPAQQPPAEETETKQKNDSPKKHKYLKTSFYTLKNGKISTKRVEENDHDLDGLAPNSDLERVDMQPEDSNMLAFKTRITHTVQKLNKDIDSSPYDAESKAELKLSVMHISRDLEQILKTKDSKRAKDLTKAIQIRLQDVLSQI